MDSAARLELYLQAEVERAAAIQSVRDLTERWAREQENRLIELRSVE